MRKNNERKNIVVRYFETGLKIRFNDLLR